MYANRLRTMALSRAVPAARSSIVQRSFQTSSRMQVSKESDLHNETNAEHKESEKQKHLKDQKEGKNEWTSTLASDSEVIIKAEKDGNKDIRTLQEESAKKAEQEQKGH